MLRVGLVCDFAEEGWPSMNLFGEMLYEELRHLHQDSLQVERIRPALQRRASSLLFLRSSRPAWNFDRLWNRTVEYPLALQKRRAEFDLFHILDHTYAHLALHLPAGRSVVTCHDLNAFDCLLKPAQEPRPFWFRAMTRRILAGLQFARHVIFVSEAVRTQAVSSGLIREERSSVIHNGAFQAAADDWPAEREADRLLDTGPGEILLLSVGSTVTRKRIDILLRVFAGVRDEVPGVRLIRVGEPFTKEQTNLARKLGVLGLIRQLPFIERPVLSAIYKRAALLLHTSENEGFGLPVAEAMALGCPAIVSDIPVLREIGGHAAFYARTGAVARWVNLTVALLGQRSNDPVLWQDVRHQSIENGRRFDWQVHAALLAAVYAKSVGTAH